MGPYGVDRAVHSMEFTDCENGLGKCLIRCSSLLTFVCLYNLLNILSYLDII